MTGGVASSFGAADAEGGGAVGECFGAGRWVRAGVCVGRGVGMAVAVAACVACAMAMAVAVAGRAACAVGVAVAGLTIDNSVAVAFGCDALIAGKGG